MQTSLVHAIGSTASAVEHPTRGAEDHRSTRYSADLRIDGWHVQPTLNLLTRDDVTVRLRAQLMDLLLCLASRPGRVFGKDDLVAEVWEGRWIAVSALSRCVAELRAALGSLICRRAAMTAITRNGNPPMAPNQNISAGRANLEISAIAPASARLIHHGERSRIANSEFSAIFSFKRHLGLRACGRRRFASTMRGSAPRARPSTTTTP